MTPFEQRMAEFRARFLARAADDAQKITAALAADDRASLREICHGLVGSAGMFGFAEVGAAAQAVEQAVDRRAPDAQVDTLAADLLKRLAALQSES